MADLIPLDVIGVIVESSCLSALPRSLSVRELFPAMVLGENFLLNAKLDSLMNSGLKCGVLE